MYIPTSYHAISSSQQHKNMLPQESLRTYLLHSTTMCQIDVHFIRGQQLVLTRLTHVNYKSVSPSLHLRFKTASNLLPILEEQKGN